MTKKSRPIPKTNYTGHVRASFFNDPPRRTVRGGLSYTATQSNDNHPLPQASMKIVANENMSIVSSEQRPARVKHYRRYTLEPGDIVISSHHALCVINYPTEIINGAAIYAGGNKPNYNREHYETVGGILAVHSAVFEKNGGSGVIASTLNPFMEGPVLVIRPKDKTFAQDINSVAQYLANCRPDNYLNARKRGMGEISTFGSDAIYKKAYKKRTKKMVKLLTEDSRYKEFSSRSPNSVTQKEKKLETIYKNKYQQTKDKLTLRQQKNQIPSLKKNQAGHYSLEKKTRGYFKNLGCTGVVAFILKQALKKDPQLSACINPAKYDVGMLFCLLKEQQSHFDFKMLDNFDGNNQAIEMSAAKSGDELRNFSTYLFDKMVRYGDFQSSHYNNMSAFDLTLHLSHAQIRLKNYQSPARGNKTRQTIVKTLAKYCGDDLTTLHTLMKLMKKIQYGKAIPAYLANSALINDLKALRQETNWFFKFFGKNGNTDDWQYLFHQLKQQYIANFKKEEEYKPYYASRARGVLNVHTSRWSWFTNHIPHETASHENFQRGYSRG